MCHLIMVVNVSVFVNVVQCSPLEIQLCSGGTAASMCMVEGEAVQSKAEQNNLLV